MPIPLFILHLAGKAKRLEIRRPVANRNQLIRGMIVFAPSLYIEAWNFLDRFVCNRLSNW
jgi:hypothetical protein